MFGREPEKLCQLFLGFLAGAGLSIYSTYPLNSSNSLYSSHAYILLSLLVTSLITDSGLGQPT